MLRTATATDLDSKIAALFTSLDNYLAQRGAAGEPESAAEKYFLSIFRHKARERTTLKRLIDSGYQPRPVPRTQTASVVSVDPMA